MANNYLSKRELTEMITREVKAALKQPNRRTLRENEAGAEEVVVTLEEAVGTSSLAAKVGLAAEHVLGPSTTKAISSALGTTGDALQQQDAIGTLVMALAFMGTVTLVGAIAAYAPQIKAAAKKLKASMSGNMAEGEDEFATALAGISPEDLKKAGQAAASDAKELMAGM
jgi:hypothetical protein